jgi:hypothetical protein
MAITESRIYSFGARQAREGDFESKFDRTVDYGPENVAEARLFDMATKILSYQEQCYYSTNPDEKKIALEKISELRRGVVLKI